MCREKKLLHFGKICDIISKYEYQKRGGAQMKEGIHPEYVDCTIKCVCGNKIHTRSTKKEIRVDICSKCHPFFTGKQKLLTQAAALTDSKRNSTFSDKRTAFRQFFFLICKKRKRISSSFSYYFFSVLTNKIPSVCSPQCDVMVQPA